MYRIKFLGVGKKLSAMSAFWVFILYDTPFKHTHLTMSPIYHLK